VSDILDRIKGNGETCTFGEIIEEISRLRAALEHTWKVIDAAGTLNLSNGVQLGPTVWYVKIEEAREISNLALKEPRT